jgi:hypothetical protein
MDKNEGGSRMIYDDEGRRMEEYGGTKGELRLIHQSEGLVE